MKVRDRLIVAVIAAVVVIGAVWLLLVSPKRGEASSLQTQIASEQVALASAQATLASDKVAAAGYLSDVRALAQVTAAIPSTADEPGVITTITKLAGTQIDVHEADLSYGSGSTSLGLVFSFSASYGTLQSFLNTLDRLTITDGSNISADGRLFTITGIALTPYPPHGAKATVTAAAYSQAGTSATTGASGATGSTATTTAAP